MLCQRPSEVQILISAFSFSFVLCSWSDESCPFLFLNILYRDVMLFWSFFDQVRCGLHICFVFFFLSQRLLNCPRHGEFSPNGIDLSKEWHFLFYFVQFFYALPAHKSRIYITKSRVSIKASYRRFTAAFKTSYRRLLLGFPLRPFSGHSRRLHPRQPLMEKITETPCISIARPPGSQSRVDSSTITYFDQFKWTLYRISEKRKEMI